MDEFILRGKVLRARLRYDQATISDGEIIGVKSYYPTLAKKRIYDSPQRKGPRIESKLMIYHR